MIENKASVYDEFRSYIIKWGRLSMILAMILAFVPLAYLASKGLFPGWSTIWDTFQPVFVSWFLLWILEPLVYYPVLGMAGTYVSWLSGNISNLRLPCAVVAQQTLQVEEGTEEGDVVATIGLCASVFVNLAIVAIFAVAGVQIVSVLPQSITVGFNYMVPAIFGSMIVIFGLRNWKVALVGILVAIALKVAAVPYALEIAGTILITIVIVIFMYKKGWIK